MATKDDGVADLSSRAGTEEYDDCTWMERRGKRVSEFIHPSILYNKSRASLSREKKSRYGGGVLQESDVGR